MTADINDFIDELRRYARELCSCPVIDARVMADLEIAANIIEYTYKGSLKAD